MNEFLTSLREDTRPLLENMRKVKPMELTIQQQEQFSKLTKDDACYLCTKPFGLNQAGKTDKVRDHDHITGKYRGAAHYCCNINAKQPKTIPVFFHNLKGYDSHLMIEYLAEAKGKDPSIIPINKEQYLGFTWESLEFKDSAAFMMSSLEKLVGLNDPDELHHTKQHFSAQQRSSKAAQQRQQGPAQQQGSAATGTATAQEKSEKTKTEVKD